MSRDRERRAATDRDTERSGDREMESERRERVAGSEREASERGATASGVEQLGPASRRPDAVAERVAPRSGGRRAVRPAAVGVADPLSANRSDERVGRRVAPVGRSRGGAPTATTAGSPAVERTERAVTEELRFADRTEGSTGAVVVEERGVERYEIPVAETFYPMADRTPEDPYPAGEPSSPRDLGPGEDPAFRWTGGSPYTSRRPALVVHRDEGPVPSLSFLQVLLRDAYKEMVGGEPTADRVEFVANEPRFPDVGRSIVTLDLSTGGWDRDVRNGRPVIEREGVDVVPELRDVAATLYTGELGYVVVNVPGEWEDPLRNPDFFDRLVAAVAGEDPDGSGNGVDADPGSRSGPGQGTGRGAGHGGGSDHRGGATRQGSGSPGSGGEPAVDRLGSPPVVLAEPTVTDPDPFYETVARYFGVAPGREGRESLLSGLEPTGVAQLETLQERVLRADDPHRVAATELRRSGEESDEHYLWKAAVVDGLVQRLYRQVGEDHDTLRAFQREAVLDPDGDVRIETEWTPEGAEGPVADVHVSEVPDWGTVATFLGGTDSVPGRDLVVEFETGIGEGAHNFRSVRRTLANYEAVQDAVSHVAVVVPPRLLFRGRGRARMLVDLVDSWEDRVAKASADLFVPRLAPGEAGAGTCWELARVGGPGGAIDDLYDGPDPNDRPDAADPGGAAGAGDDRTGGPDE